MEIVAKDGETGQRTIDELGHDPLVSSLLVLYGLHPLDLESRVDAGRGESSSACVKGGGELELLGIDGSAVRLQLHVTGHACGSTGKTLKPMVEEALYEAAPDSAGLLIEGLDEQIGLVRVCACGQARQRDRGAPRNDRSEVELRRNSEFGNDRGQ